MNPTTPKHSPLPWKFGDKSLHVFANDGQHIATINVPMSHWEQEQTRYNDVRYMLDACNSHYDNLATIERLGKEKAELVEVLKALVNDYANDTTQTIFKAMRLLQKMNGVELPIAETGVSNG